MGATKSQKCLHCGTPMQRIYIQATISGKRRWLSVGWLCGNPACCSVMLDDVTM